MVSFFPHPYNDETFYSTLARYHIWSGNLIHKTTMRELFNSKNVSASFDLPCHIADLVSNLPQCHTLTAEEIILNHTLFPFYTAFISEIAAERICKLMLSDYGGSIHLILGIAAGTIKSHSHLMFCPECNQESLKTYGEYYWHRIHNIPSVCVCSKHGVALFKSIVDLHNHKRQEYVSADKINCFITGYNGKKLPEKKKFQSLAEDAAYLLEHYPEMRSVAKMENGFRGLYLSRLHNRGLVTESDRLRLKPLCNNFHTFYGKQFLTYLKSDVSPDNGSNWLFCLLRKPRKAIHPVRHLLLIRFLWGSLENMIIGTTNNLEKTSEHGLPTLVKTRKKSIQQLAAYDTELFRHKWIELQESHPGCLKTEMRRLYPALFACLYRHDRMWLNTHSPQPTRPKGLNKRVNWHKRDTQTLKKAKIAVRKILSSHTRPKRLTVTRIGTETGRLSWIEKYPDKMQRTISYINSATETIEEFQIRRVWWCAKTLSELSIVPIKWKIERMAGLHPGYSQAVITAINKAVYKYSLPQLKSSEANVKCNIP